MKFKDLQHATLPVAVRVRDYKSMQYELPYGENFERYHEVLKQLSGTVVHVDKIDPRWIMLEETSIVCGWYIIEPLEKKLLLEKELFEL